MIFCTGSRRIRIVPFFLLDDLPIVLDPSLCSFHDIHKDMRFSLAGFRFPPTHIQDTRDALGGEFSVLRVGPEMIRVPRIGMDLHDTLPRVLLGKGDHECHVNVPPIVQVHWQFEKSRNSGGAVGGVGIYKYLVAIARDDVLDFGTQRIQFLL